MRMTRLAVAVGAMGVVGSALAVDLAVDFSDEAQVSRLPRLRQKSFETEVVSGHFAHGLTAYRLHITQAWFGELPQWPSVNIVPAIRDWSAYDRLVIDVYNAVECGDRLAVFVANSANRVQEGLRGESCTLADHDITRWTISLKNWPATMDAHNVDRLHIFMDKPASVDAYLDGFYLLKPGEAVPVVDPDFEKKVLAPHRAKVAEARAAHAAAAREQFAARCRAAGQKGRVAWIGQATSMEKIRPRDGFAARPAKRFALAAARGEKESLQVFVMPAARDLRKVTVRVSDLRSDRATLASACFKASPVGYVNATNPAPYRIGRNVVSTNAPTGVVRERIVAETGWWPDPILDYLDCADVAKTDLQGFWVRFTCPRDQKPGVYRGALTVAGEGWSEKFPLEVRVWDFEVPKASPLPLAITFAPGVRPTTKDAPLAPCRLWAKHRAAWVDMLADYYITFDNIYNGGAVPVEDWRRLEGQGRLGLVNVGYWSYPAKMDEATLAAWEQKTRRHLDAAYAAVKANGWLEKAYLYGCDEVKPEFFPNIRYAIEKLKAWYPGVPLFTTAYDHDFGVGTPLEGMDWFTPLTPRYVEHFAKVAPSRAAGHRVWWYICCSPHAPCANMFVESQAIEGRLLMGAQTVKWRPDGFLYYQTAIWNATQAIEGPSTFTTWEPISWTNYHGDGSWFCAGPDGSPCATVRIENFRDGLEDYAYALEYERVTGKSCPVPERITSDIGVYTDDPKLYYAWRNGIAERIEAARHNP